uniref:Uncharacterized protein n=1 Tax=Glossina brevipalpis TaxID=37001 RepID=A0A1A9X3X3_9MUSC
MKLLPSVSLILTINNSLRWTETDLTNDLKCDMNCCYTPKSSERLHKGIIFKIFGLTLIYLELSVVVNLLLILRIFSKAYTIVPLAGRYLGAFSRLNSKKADYELMSNRYWDSKLKKRFEILLLIILMMVTMNTHLYSLKELMSVQINKSSGKNRNICLKFWPNVTFKDIGEKQLLDDFQHSLNTLAILYHIHFEHQNHCPYHCYHRSRRNI